MVKISIRANFQINATLLTTNAANPVQVTAAPGEHDPSAQLCLTPTPTQRPNTTQAIPPHTSQALEHPTARPPNTHRPASSKLSF